MIIEEEKLASRVLSGCAPVDAIIDLAGNFMGKVRGLVVDMGKGLLNWLREFSLVGVVVDKITDLINGLKGAVSTAEQVISGTVVWAGATLGPCAKVIGGTLIGAVVGGGAIMGLATLVSGATAWAGGIAGAGLITKLGLAISVGTGLRFMVGATRKIYNFNWNISDEAIDNQQKGLISNFYSVLGGSLGEASGRLVCGVASAKVVSSLSVSPQTLARVEELIKFSGGENGLEASGQFIQEAVDALWPILEVGGRAAMNWLFLETYQNIRRIIKAAAKFPGLSFLLPDDVEDAIASWGKGDAWSFRQATEDAIERIENQSLQNFTEEFLEEFFESCAETVMVVSYA